MTTPDGTTFTDVSVPFLPSDQHDDDQPGRAQAARRRHAARTTSSRSRASSPRPAWCRTRSSPRSTRARWRPQVAIVAYEGYLGLDSGHPAVGLLARPDPDRPRPAEPGGRGEPEAGRRRMTLPDGTTISFTGFKRVRRPAVLARPRPGAGCWARRSSLLIGLLGMLLLRRERVFARVAPAPARRRYRADASPRSRGAAARAGRASPP